MDKTDVKLTDISVLGIMNKKRQVQCISLYGLLLNYIRTPRYKGQLFFSQALTFSLNLNGHPVDTDTFYGPLIVRTKAINGV